jgi:hypothetical protein
VPELWPDVLDELRRIAEASSGLYGVRLGGNQFRDSDQVVGDEIQQKCSGDTSNAAVLGLAHCAMLFAPAEDTFHAYPVGCQFGKSLSWFRQVGAVLICIFVIWIINDAEAPSFELVPSAEGRSSSELVFVNVNYEAAKEEFCRIIGIVIKLPMHLVQEFGRSDFRSGVSGNVLARLKCNLPNLICPLDWLQRLKTGIFDQHKFDVAFDNFGVPSPFVSDHVSYFRGGSRWGYGEQEQFANDQLGPLHLNDGATHIAGLRGKGYQLENENTKLDNADKDLIPGIFDKFPIIRSQFFRLYVLLFGLGLLFCGGYDIYRERFILGSAMIACGFLLGLLVLSVGLFLLAE